MDINKVASGIYQVQFQLPGAVWITTAHLVTEGKGAIVEPGPAAGIPFLRRAMEEVGMREPAYIIPTHIHLDHAGAMGSLARTFPGAKVLLHPAAVKHAIDPSKLIAAYRQAFGDGFESVYGAFAAVPASQVQAAEDGETISLNGRAFQVLHAPGHASHHMVLFDRSSGVLFCGEALGLPLPGTEQSPVPAAPSPFDPEVYLRTAQALRKLHPRLLLYSHYGPGLDPEVLIQRMVENTGIFGEIVLSGLKAGEKAAAIGEKIRKRFHMERMDQLLFDGFIYYFRKNGAV